MGTHYDTLLETIKSNKPESRSKRGFIDTSCLRLSLENRPAADIVGAHKARRFLSGGAALNRLALLMIGQRRLSAKPDAVRHGADAGLATGDPDADKPWPDMLRR
jgi:hypothetical protein